MVSLAGENKQGLSFTAREKKDREGRGGQVQICQKGFCQSHSEGKGLQRLAMYDLEMKVFTYKSRAGIASCY
jgi:hypothetical protein